MFGRLARRSHYCFLDGYLGYNQAPIALEDQEKTIFTCPFGAYAFKRVLFRLCNAPATFQRCMMSTFFEFITKIMELFMDNFTLHVIHLISVCIILR